MTTNDELFDRFTALTYDDVVVVPGYANVLPSDVDTSSMFARDIRLSIPVVSAAMDRVTEARLAIALAREGGIGVLHRNLDIDAQAAEVQRVKRSQSGMITDPVTLPPTATIAQAEALMGRFRFSGVPITDETGLLIGILTNRDTRFLEAGDEHRPVSDYMTRTPLITAPTGTTLIEAKALLHRHRIEKLPLVDEFGHLTGLITVKDLAKHREHPNANVDSQGRLRVAGAIGVGTEAEKRAEALLRAGVDAVSIDTAHGHSKGVIDTIRALRSSFPDLIITAGNVVTEEGVEALVAAGADAVKVGVGAGSICTTRVVAGAGMPQLSAVHFAATQARKLGIPVIADGGVTFSGDLVKAIAAGASAIMIGSLLAGTDESPGEFELFEGRRYKSYRGMGSMGAMADRHAADRYSSSQRSKIGPDDDGEDRHNAGGKLVPEGIEGRVAYSGSLHDVVHQLVGGLRSGMGYAGAASINELQGKRLMRITAAGSRESHPHDIQITKEAPNYQRL